MLWPTPRRSSGSDDYEKHALAPLFPRWLAVSHCMVRTLMLTSVDAAAKARSEATLDAVYAALEQLQTVRTKCLMS